MSAPLLAIAHNLRSTLVRSRDGGHCIQDGYAFTAMFSGPETEKL